MRVLDYRNKRHMQFLGKKWWLLDDFLKIGLTFLKWLSEIYVYKKEYTCIHIYLYCYIQLHPFQVMTLISY